jgi:hypothetical protein
MTRARPLVLCAMLGCACSFFEFAPPSRQDTVDQADAGSPYTPNMGSGVGGSIHSGLGLAGDGSELSGTAGSSEEPSGGCEPEAPSLEPRCESTMQNAAGCGVVEGPYPPSCVCGPGYSTDRVALIDDFDDGDTCLRHVGQRMGFWFGTRNDCLYAPNVFCDAERRSRVLGIKGELDGGPWGLAIWLNSTNYCPEGDFDASEYEGVRFSVKAAETTIMDLRLRDRYSRRNYGATPEEEHGSTLRTEICVGPLWQELEVPFSAFRRNDPEAFPEPLDAASLRIVEWGAVDVARYELYVDDVAFY